VLDGILGGSEGAIRACGAVPSIQGSVPHGLTKYFPARKRLSRIPPGPAKWTLGANRQQRRTIAALPIHVS